MKHSCIIFSGVRVVIIPGKEKNQENEKSEKILRKI